MKYTLALWLRDGSGSGYNFAGSVDLSAEQVLNVIVGGDLNPINNIFEVASPWCVSFRCDNVATNLNPIFIFPSYNPTEMAPWFGVIFPKRSNKRDVMSHITGVFADALVENYQ